MMDKETDLRKNLAIAYQAFAIMGMDDLTYTHLSARVPGADAYFIFPFGLLFEETTPQNLLKVSFSGEVLEGAEHQYNQTGYIMHGAIYRSRPDVNAVFHLHTTANVAVSAMKEGLLPISQWALHFYDRVAYHAYDSLTLDAVTQGDPFIRDLGDKRTMLMQNHGALTCGQTIHEAFFYMHHLEQACRAQIAALSTGAELTIPSKEICEKAVHDLLSFEKDLGKRDWLAITRLVDRHHRHHSVAPKVELKAA